MFRNLLILLSLAGSVMAQSLDQIPPEFSVHNPKKKPEVPNLLRFSEKSLQMNHWINEFKIVILVNKANTGSSAQTLKLFKDGVLTYTTRTSTGREKWEEKGYWSTTPAGYFMVKAIKEDYVSKLWGSHMPHSVFFIGGIAVHEGHEPAKLGQRASGGCVRVSPESAEHIYNIVNAAGKANLPVVRFDGRLEGDKRVQSIDAIVVVVDEITP